MCIFLAADPHAVGALSRAWRSPKPKVLGQELEVKAKVFMYLNHSGAVICALLLSSPFLLASLSQAEPTVASLFLCPASPSLLGPATSGKILFLCDASSLVSSLALPPLLQAAAWVSSKQAASVGTLVSCLSLQAVPSPLLAPLASLAAESETSTSHEAHGAILSPSPCSGRASFFQLQARSRLGLGLEPLVLQPGLPFKSPLSSARKLPTSGSCSLPPPAR